MKTLVPLLIALVPATEDEDLAAIVDALVAPYVEAGHLSGTILVGHRDEVLLERAYGLANAEHGVPNRPDTRHCVASVTKDMTVIVAARLIERGALALSDPLAKFVPSFPNGEEITVELLLNHRAGIPHRVTSAMQETVPRTAAEMTELAARAEPLFAPGEATAYSSAGYSVLARVLEVASGKGYAQLLQDEVCAPAGLANTVHASSLELVPDRAQSYVVAAGGLRNTPLKDMSFLVGAGSVYSTAGDLFRMARAALNGDYGPTARMVLLRGRGGLSMNGATSGFRAYLDYDGQTEITVAFTGNVPTGVNDLLRRALPRILAGEEVELPPPPAVEAVAVDDEVLRSCEGVYELGGSSYTVTASEGVLLVGDWILVPVGERTFFSTQDYAEVRAVVDDDGRVTHLDWGGDRMTRVAGG